MDYYYYPVSDGYMHVCMDPAPAAATAACSSPLSSSRARVEFPRPTVVRPTLRISDVNASAFG
jgi:hypothetical protein